MGAKLKSLVVWYISRARATLADTGTEADKQYEESSNLAIALVTLPSILFLMSAHHHNQVTQFEVDDVDCLRLRRKAVETSCRDSSVRKE